MNGSSEICTYQETDNTQAHAYFSKECYSSGRAQVAEGCQDVSLEEDLHEDQGRSDMARAYLLHFTMI